MHDWQQQVPVAQGAAEATQCPFLRGTRRRRLNGQLAAAPALAVVAIWVLARRRRAGFRYRPHPIDVSAGWLLDLHKSTFAVIFMHCWPGECSELTIHLRRTLLPTLILQALDEPFIRMTPETRAKLLGNCRVRLI